MKSLFFGFILIQETGGSKCELRDLEEVTGISGQIDSLTRKSVTCPSWYQSWQGYNQCYPAEEFSWCWNVRPKCSKVRLRFTRFAIEEQSRVMHNYYGFKGEDVCLDYVKVKWSTGYNTFCDESHQNKREFTFSDNKEFDPYLKGWFEWVELQDSAFNVSFTSNQFGGSGSSNFVGFALEWECMDSIYDECANQDHECSVYESCVDKPDGYSCHMRQADDPEVLAERTKMISTEIQQRGIKVNDGSLKERIKLNFGKLGVNNECTTCHPDAKCVHNKCICTAGFMGSGQFCVPLGGECRPVTAALCSQDALCHELFGDKHMCTCKEGFQGDGVTCTTILPTSSKPCINCDPSAKCFNGNCVCNTGWFGNGIFCLPNQLAVDKSDDGSDPINDNLVSENEIPDELTNYTDYESIDEIAEVSSDKNQDNATVDEILSDKIDDGQVKDDNDLAIDGSTNSGSDSAMITADSFDKNISAILPEDQETNPTNTPLNGAFFTTDKTSNVVEDITTTLTEIHIVTDYTDDSTKGAMESTTDTINVDVLYESDIDIKFDQYTVTSGDAADKTSGNTSDVEETHQDEIQSTNRNPSNKGHIKDLLPMHAEPEELLIEKIDVTTEYPYYDIFPTTTFYETTGSSDRCELVDPGPTGSCIDVLSISFEHVLCLDTVVWNQKEMKEVKKMKTKLLQLSNELCNTSQNQSQAYSRCIDVTTPNQIFYNKFLIATKFDSWTTAYRNMATKRFRYCRRKGSFKKKLYKVEKMYLKIVQT